MRHSAVLTFALVLVLLPATYVAAPFWTAWSIREAIKSGDSAYLSRKIDFERVRASLRPSLARIAFDMPQPADGEAATKPSLWKRIKAYWGQSAVDRFVDTYVTPEGLSQLFEWRQSYRKIAASAPDDSELSRWERFRRFWARVVRAEFKSPVVFEIEVADKNDPEQHHIGLLELEGFEWRLTSLRIVHASQDPGYATAILPSDR